MQTFDANGARLTLALFIKAYNAARNLAPARFLTLRIHPLEFKALVDESEGVTHILQVGTITGHLGRQATKVACVAAANGLGDGVTVEPDETADRTKLEFQIHKSSELEIVNLAPSA